MSEVMLYSTDYLYGLMKLGLIIVIIFESLDTNSEVSHQFIIDTLAEALVYKL